MASGVVDVTTGLADAQRAFERCEAGEPAVGFGEIYVQTQVDPSPALGRREEQAAPRGARLEAVVASVQPVIEGLPVLAGDGAGLLGDGCQAATGVEHAGRHQRPGRARRQTSGARPAAPRRRLGNE